MKDVRNGGYYITRNFMIYKLS